MTRPHSEDARDQTIALLGLQTAQGPATGEEPSLEELARMAEGGALDPQRRAEIESHLVNNPALFQLWQCACAELSAQTQQAKTTRFSLSIAANQARWWMSSAAAVLLVGIFWWQPEPEGLAPNSLPQPEYAGIRILPELAQTYAAVLRLWADLPETERRRYEALIGQQPAPVDMEPSMLADDVALNLLDALRQCDQDGSLYRHDTIAILAQQLHMAPPADCKQLVELFSRLQDTGSR